MSEDSHFRTLKVQRLAPTAISRINDVFPPVEKVTPSNTLYPDGPFNFNCLCVGVRSSLAAASGPRLIIQNDASSNAWTGDILSSTNSRIKGGMA